MRQSIESAAPGDSAQHMKILSRSLPILIVASLFLAWEAAVHLLNVNRFILPAPSAIAQALVQEWSSLMSATRFTLAITWSALLLAVVSGIGLGVLVHRSRIGAATVLPIALALQVTPIVAIAPIILVWTGVESPARALLLIAWIVAFFPVMAAALTGLKSIPQDLRDLFDLYRAKPLQRFWRLDVPAILPTLLGGIKVAAGLALIGAVVAEFAAGSGTSQGLAWVLIQAVQQLELELAFACLFLLTFIGIVQYLLIDWIEKRILKARGLGV
jgi:NitT/TauT family transport system permease protein